MQTLSIVLGILCILSLPILWGMITQHFRRHDSYMGEAEMLATIIGLLAYTCITLGLCASMYHGMLGQFLLSAMAIVTIGCAITCVCVYFPRIGRWLYDRFQS